jgi:hypothetical protein
VSAPVPGWPDPPDDADRPAEQAAFAAEQAAAAADQAATNAGVAADRAARAAEQATDLDRGQSAGAPPLESADVVVPVEVPVPIEVPVAVPVPIEAGQPWTGTVIDAVPTTADDIAALVLSVPDVVRLHAGRFGEVATYLPGRRVTGVKVGDDLIEVHVVVAGLIPVRQTAQAIHEAIATLVATPVHVFVEDVAA